MGDAGPSTSGTDGSETASEGARREALKKAGEAYFNKVLEKAQAGKDPFVPHPARLRKGADVEALDRDPDLEIVGLVLAGVRLYFIGALFVAASAVSFVLIKESLQPLRTPGIQAFLHSIPVVAALWFLVDVTPLTGPVLKGLAPTSCLAAVQARGNCCPVLALFGALLYCDVKLVLASVCLMPQCLAAALAVLQGRRLGMAEVALLGVGGVGAVAGLFAGRWPGLLGTLCLLGWAAGEAGKAGWQAFKAQPDMGRPYMGEQQVQLLRAAAEEEARLGAPVVAFYQRALPALPILLFGFACREGAELVSHELSVPAVSTMLLSVLAWGAAAASSVLLWEALSQRTWTLLRALGAVGTLCVAVVVYGGALWPIMASVLVVGSAVLLQMLPFLGQILP